MAKATNCPAETALAHFAEGTLPPETTSEIEKHIDACAECRLALSAAVRTAGPEAPMWTRLGRYELRSPIGSGAMGTVYAGYDPELDRRIAIKLLAPVADPTPERLERHRDR